MESPIGAPPAMAVPIVPPLMVTADILQQLSVHGRSSNRKPRGKPSAASGSGGGKATLDNSFLLPSMSSGGSPSDWRGFWKQPKTVKDLASQAAAVCTKLLNGQLDLIQAQMYSSVLRSVAALVHASVMKAKMDEKPPDLGLEGDLYEHEE